MSSDGKAPDPVEMMDGVLKAFAAGPYSETRRELEDSVQRPVDPGAYKLTGQERKADDAAFLADPLGVRAAADEEAARFKLQPDRPISKRVWERIKRAAREAE